MIGRVVLRAFPMEGGRSVWQYEVQEGVNAASLCVGLTPEEGVNVLSRVFGCVVLLIRLQHGKPLV